jgi:hypothetical protein
MSINITYFSILFISRSITLTISKNSFLVYIHGQNITRVLFVNIRDEFFKIIFLKIMI